MVLFHFRAAEISMDSKKQLSLMLGLNEQMENWMPPWSVWSDNDINAERWEPVKGKHPRPGSQVSKIAI